MSVSKFTNPVVREGQAEITSKRSAPDTDATEPFRSNQLWTDSSPKSCTAAGASLPRENLRQAGGARDCAAAWETEMRALRCSDRQGRERHRGQGQKMINYEKAGLKRTILCIFLFSSQYCVFFTDFWLHYSACGTLVPQPGITPRPPPVGAES